MEYYSAIKRNKTGSFVETWIDLETERSKSKREKQISYINGYTWNLKKLVQTILFTKQKYRHRGREQMYFMDTEGESGGGRNWEVGIDIYMLLILCIEWVANEDLLCSTGSSTR